MKSSRGRVLAGCLVVALAAVSPAWGGEESAGRVLGPDTVAGGGSGAPRLASAACAEGVVKDDGTVESGYGWVPSVIEGVYVQQFDSAELPERQLESACVCWLRTRPDSDIDFEVVVYRDAGGLPEMEPYAAVPARAVEVPEGVAAAGRFFDVDLAGVPIPQGVFYLGVRWNPSVDQYFFVCVDRSPSSPVVPGFYIDDRSDEWGSVLDTPDPVFTDHHAMMIRIEGVEQVPWEVPALGPVGAAALAAALAALGARRLGPRRRTPC